MKSRRSFIKTIGKGAAISTLAFSSTTAFASQLMSKPDQKPKQIRIGIIGAENSHTIGFGKIFNVEKKFPGVEVKYVWGETDEFASNAAAKGEIPNIVKEPKEMLGKIDALINKTKAELDLIMKILSKLILIKAYLLKLI